MAGRATWVASLMVLAAALCTASAHANSRLRPLPFWLSDHAREAGKGLASVHFAGQSQRPRVARVLRRVGTSSRTRITRDIDAACAQAVNAAINKLLRMSRGLGGDGVVDIVSNWRHNPRPSAHDYPCEVGRNRVGVAFQGMAVVLQPRSRIAREPGPTGRQSLRVTVGNQAAALRLRWDGTPQPNWVRADVSLRLGSAPAQGRGPHADCTVWFHGVGQQPVSAKALYRSSSGAETVSAHLTFDHIRALGLGQASLRVCQTPIALSADDRTQIQALLEAITAQLRSGGPSGPTLRPGKGGD